jgi:hypothetical protein
LCSAYLTAFFCTSCDRKMARRSRAEMLPQGRVLLISQTS